MECRVEGCQRPILVKRDALCAMHYWRQHREGDVGEPGYRKGTGVPYRDRILARTRVMPNGCIEWTGPTYPTGYGMAVRRSNDGATPAHRAVYELLVGPIPDGLTIDHLCKNRICVNVDHMEPVTRAENTRRAHPLKDACHRGHPLAGDNVVMRSKSRRCRTCERENARRYYHEKRAANAG